MHHAILVAVAFNKMVNASVHHATLVAVVTNNKVNAYISDHTHRTTEAQPAYARTVAKNIWLYHSSWLLLLLFSSGPWAEACQKQAEQVQTNQSVHA